MVLGAWMGGWMDGDTHTHRDGADARVLRAYSKGGRVRPCRARPRRSNKESANAHPSTHTHTTRTPNNAHQPWSARRSSRAGPSRARAWWTRARTAGRSTAWRFGRAPRSVRECLLPVCGRFVLGGGGRSIGWVVGWLMGSPSGQSIGRSIGPHRCLHSRVCPPHQLHRTWP